MRILTLILAASLTVAGGALAQTAPQTPAVQDRPVDPDRIIKRLDKDNDQQISQAEWTEGGRNARGFARYDTDSNGQLDMIEVQAMATALTQRRASRGQ
ncbi:hypothetical protein [Brevundimonas sp.]|uniref:hypothetical protein n=1 Tax=Brevundimonas sp. TaxID=1871086 RepID=UPI002ABB388B|nr:hypothetical protein [Brevundimonas sp.]MDZ4363714.1 hypothetical protein [Brevundimonas sp.]